MNTVKEYQKPIMVGAIGVVVAIMLYALLVAPQSSKLSSLNTQKTQLAAQQQQLQVKLTSLEKDKQQLPTKCASLQKITLQIPSVSESRRPGRRAVDLLQPAHRPGRFVRHVDPLVRLDREHRRPGDHTGHHPPDGWSHTSNQRGRPGSGQDAHHRQL